MTGSVPSFIRVLPGDCLEVMRELPDNSLAAVVTDPPYGLSFMGKHWDQGVPGVPFWAEMLRLLKPGGHLLSFAGSRTYHRMACAIEDAGFEIRDQIMWVYGSGFPKNKNALKPAHEPLCLARKPLSEKTVAANVLKYGTGGLNVDGCRIEGVVPTTTQGQAASAGTIYGADQRTLREFVPNSAGRYPANFIHDGSQEVLELFPTSSSRSGGTRGQSQIWGSAAGQQDRDGYDDSGSAARFFYTAKASRTERQGSKHPTIKPLALMRYLVRLITPPGGTILDPFAGSGTTGQAALLEGFKAILIERETEYIADIKRRIGAAEAVA